MTMEKTMHQGGFLIVIPSLLAGLISWSYLFIHRFSHSGMVCSGVYLEDHHKENSDGYMQDTGLFIKSIFRLFEMSVVIVLTAVIMILTFERVT